MVNALQIAGYTRISVDDEKDKGEHTSIENQREIISDYVASNFPTATLTFYSDRDRSGYTFDQREEYVKLRKELFSGRFNVLIVKDFSRFSRRNSLGLYELETLRDADVRIISIGDGIDYPTKDDWMLIQFKFLMNEMPVTDTSKKIKAVIANRQKNGKWVCAVPYGYRIINTKEMTYEIDPPAAEVVREIYRLYNNGWGYKKIANHLTEAGVPTPRTNEIMAKEAAGKTTRQKTSSVWSIISVSEILKNDFYIGTLRQKKYTREKINGKDRALDESEHIVIEAAHAPVIEKKTFLLTQENHKTRSKSNYRGTKKYDTAYSGFLFCGDCGAPMFSMSRPDLAPAYTCGTYHKRGRKGCTSHHIRVDTLDTMLKRYIAKIKDNAGTMIAQLTDAIKNQDEKEDEIGRAIDGLARQLEDSKSQLKNLYKRKIIDTMSASPERIAIVEESYIELEKELLERIAGLEKQVDQNVDNRNKLLRFNRMSKTVLDVFDDILEKPKLSKMDLTLIVERITVYQSGVLEVRLKADVDALLALEQESSENFSFGSKDIETLIQPSVKREDKVFTVNVISSGDPLEIYTDKDGGVIFKKYSLMSGLGDFSAQLCETLHKTTGRIVAIADRDSCIAVAGSAKRALTDKRISSQLEQIMEGRQIFQHQDGSAPIAVSDDSDEYFIETVAPILSEGDVLGCVIFSGTKDSLKADEVELKLAQTIAGFLGKHMES